MIQDDLKRDEAPALPSEQSFGHVFAGVGAIAAALCAWYGRFGAAGGLVLAAAALLAVAHLAPALLRAPNRLWFRFGMVLHRVMQPLVLGVMFFGIVAPIGLLMRATGGDPLRLKRRPGRESYWIERDAPDPAPDSFRNQF